MIVTAYKTHKIVPNEDLISILDKYLPKLGEKSIVAISSKIMSLCQGRIVKKSPDIKKDDLIKKECSYYFDGRKMVEHGVVITIKNGVFGASSGVDESNGQDIYMLWPTDINETCEKIWLHLKEKHGIKELGIIVTDSHSSPMKWGVIGVGIGWCGIEPLFNYKGRPDIWNKYLKATVTNHLEALAIAAVHEMGEADEQTPLAVISEAKKVIFTDKAPSKEETKAYEVPLDKDIYSPILKSVTWQKGGDF